MHADKDVAYAHRLMSFSVLGEQSKEACFNIQFTAHKYATYIGFGFVPLSKTACGLEKMVGQGYAIN